MAQAKRAIHQGVGEVITHQKYHKLENKKLARWVLSIQLLLFTQLIVFNKL